MMFNSKGKAEVTYDAIVIGSGISGGFAAIFLLLLLMHAYAFTKREGLELNRNEIVICKGRMMELAIYVAFGLLSIGLAFVDNWVPFSGLIYILVGPAQGLNGYLWGRLVEEDAQVEASAPQ